MSPRPAVLMNCVRVGPGARCVQVTPVPRRSSATHSEKLLTNALLAAYPASSPCGMTYAAIEPTFRIAPRPSFTIRAA